jgi:hypothetical protein
VNPNPKLVEKAAKNKSYNLNSFSDKIKGSAKKVSILIDSRE